MGYNGPPPPGPKPAGSPSPPAPPRGMIAQTGNRPGGMATDSYKSPAPTPDSGRGFISGLLFGWLLNS